MRSIAPLTAFALGACAATAVQSSGGLSRPAGAARPPVVTPAGAAATAVAPNGTATITHLARGENAYLGRLEIDPGAGVPKHRDPTEEYIHVLEGSGTMTIDGTEYAVTPGATVYMPAGVEVSFVNGDAKMVALQVFAGPGPSAKYERWEAAR